MILGLTVFRADEAMTAIRESSERLAKKEQE